MVVDVVVDDSGNVREVAATAIGAYGGWRGGRQRRRGGVVVDSGGLVGERKKEFNRTRRARFEKSRDFPTRTDHRRNAPHMRHASPHRLHGPSGRIIYTRGPRKCSPHHSAAYLLRNDLVYSFK